MSAPLKSTRPMAFANVRLVEAASGMRFFTSASTCAVMNVSMYEPSFICVRVPRRAVT